MKNHQNSWKIVKETSKTAKKANKKLKNNQKL